MYTILQFFNIKEILVELEEVVNIKSMSKIMLLLVLLLVLLNSGKLRSQAWQNPNWSF